MATRQTPTTITPDVIIDRVFDAPRELVWKAWTEPERVKRWWGPKMFTAPVCTVDLRVGGKYHFCMRDGAGKDYWSTGTYREIVAPERLVYTDSFSNERGDIVPASEFGLGDNVPLEMLITVTLTEQGGKTHMALRVTGMPVGEMREMAIAGWNESLDKFAAAVANRLVIILPSDREIVMTRTFALPRDLLFRAYTDPELIPRWWGPRNTTTEVDKLDIRPGGAWRFIQRSEGEEYAFRGEFKEIVPPEKLVYTFEFEPLAGHVALETITFTVVEGGTLLTDHALFDSAEDRDGMLQTGMETGANESMDRLEEVLQARA